MAQASATDVSVGEPVQPAPPRSRPPSRIRATVRIFATAALTLLAISVLVFAAGTFKSPEDVARAALGRDASPEALQAYAQERGLTDPLPVRYARWLGDFVQGDLGVSLVNDQPVADAVIPRMRNTLLLALVALVIAVPASVALGAFMARRRGSPVDLTLLFGSVVLAALPEFVLGIALIMIFAVQLGWFPVDSTAVSFGTPSEIAAAYVLPALTLVLAMVPHISRIARASASESLDTPYVASATLRGLRPRRVMWDYGMRNAAVPMVNAVALNVVYLLGGVIVVEQVFAFPGIGQLLVEAIGNGDATMVLAIAVILGAMFIVISLIADLLAIYFNPRLRTSS